MNCAHVPVRNIIALLPNNILFAKERRRPEASLSEGYGFGENHNLSYTLLLRWAACVQKKEVGVWQVVAEVGLCPTGMGVSKWHSCPGAPNSFSSGSPGTPPALPQMFQAQFCICSYISPAFLGGLALSKENGNVKLQSPACQSSTRGNQGAEWQDHCLGFKYKETSLPACATPTPKAHAPHAHGVT